MTQNERFWAKVLKSDGCWLWTASKRHKGYGAFQYVRDGEIVPGRAHRYSWEIHFGPIPQGLCVLHRCDTPACVRPDHLFLGTIAENNLDMDQKGRRVRAGSLCGLGKYKRGTVHHSAKLNEDIVRDIRRLYADGTSLSELAVKFGVNQSAIWKVATRKLWRHVI